MKKRSLPYKIPLLYSLIILLLGAALQTTARLIPGFGDFYAVRVYPKLIIIPGKLFSLLPFSLHEILIYLAILLGIGLPVYGGYLIARRRRCKNYFLKAAIAILCLGSTCFLILSLNWSVNYSRTGFIKENWPGGNPSISALKDLSQILIQDLQDLEEELTRDSQGLFSLDKALLNQKTKASMEAVGQVYPELAGYYPKPKAILWSSKMSDLDLTGIFSPITGEANYNKDIRDYLIPFTICHELAHYKGFIREDEANFAAYLSCLHSPFPEFRYSGALNGLSYTLNALARNLDSQGYQEILATVPEQALADLRANSQYWQEHRGKLAQISQAANDLHLKANSQKDGVLSYGKMVELLINYYGLS